MTPQFTPAAVSRVTVASESGKFLSWPANGGIWTRGEEVLVGFKSHDWTGQNEAGHHCLDPEGDSEWVQARSHDGGRTWGSVEPLGALLTGDIPVDFKDPGFVMRCFMSHHTGQAHSLVAMSNDFGRTWGNLAALPDLGRVGHMARTDYLVLDSRRALLFTTVTKRSGVEGTVLCLRTEDAGRTWHLLGAVGSEPDRGCGFRIMPSTVADADAGFILTAVRRSYGNDRGHAIEFFHSADVGRTWKYAGKLDNVGPGLKGNPPSLVYLGEGRIVLTYGVRSEPFRVCAMTGMFDGDAINWGFEAVLDSGLPDWDMGYPRSCLVDGGKALFTAYYVNDRAAARSEIRGAHWRFE